MRRTLVIACAFLMALLFAVPAYAADGSYSIDELSTEVTVQSDGSLHVVERQVVTFSERNQGMTWYLYSAGDGESVRMNSVRSAPVDDGGTAIGNWTRLQMIDSNPSQQGRNPGDQAAPALRATDMQPWYSYNIGDGMMRCYFPTGADAVKAAGTNGGAANDENEDAAQLRTYAIETDYTLFHHVRIFRDVDELYWRYAHDSLPADANDVTLQVLLPAPAGELPVSGDTVMAWGHGHDEGTFSVGENGTVTYHIALVEQGNYADAHVIFPAHWTPDVAEGSANTFSEQRRAAAVADEADWVDAATRGANWDYKVRILFLAAMVIVLLVGTAAVLRHGRSAQSRRALVRVAATLAIVALGEHLFFREPLTTTFLAIAALIVAVASVMLPLTDDEEDPGDQEGTPDEGRTA